VEECFTKHVTVLNYSEIHHHDNLLRLTALSSGFHIGASNWLIEIGTHKFGILRNSSDEAEFRHPLALNLEPFQDLDVLIVGSIARPISAIQDQKQ
jgi:Cft2 family RNA processing exonuclease